MSGSSLPPSPPLTASPALAHKQSPADSPPTSPKKHSTSSSPQPSSVSYPLPPLTAELFFNVLSFLPQRDRPRLGLVSKSWHAFLSSEPCLWPSLTVQLHQDQDEHVALWTDRARDGRGGSRGGGVRSLALVLASLHTPRAKWGDAVPDALVSHRLARVFDALDEVCMEQVRVLTVSGREKVVNRPAPTLQDLRLWTYPSTLATLHLLAGVMSASCRDFAQAVRS